MSIKFTMRQARDILEHAVLHPLTNGQHRVVYLEGDPGIGKTAMAYAVYDKYRRTKANPDGFTHFVPFIAPEREPTDIGGLPMPNASRTATTMLPAEEFLYNEGDRPFIFFDEIDKAIAMMQNAVGRVWHERTVCNRPLPKGTFVCAAGNAMTNRAGSVTALSHMKGRRTHVPVEVNALEWIEDVGIPFDLHSSVVSYIRTDTTALHKLDTNAPSFPSPRSWTKVGLELNNVGMSETVERAMIEGDIGVEASNAFWGHLRIFRDLRDPEVIIKNPKEVDLPKGKNAVAIMYCEVTALARYANARNCEAIFTYMDRLPGEYGFVGFRDVMQRDSRLITTSKTGAAWFVKNATTLKSTAA